MLDSHYVELTWRKFEGLGVRRCAVGRHAFQLFNFSSLPAHCQSASLQLPLSCSIWNHTLNNDDALRQRMNRQNLSKSRTRNRACVRCVVVELDNVVYQYVAGVLLFFMHNFAFTELWAVLPSGARSMAR